MDDAEFAEALGEAVSKGAPELTGTPPAEPETTEVVEEAPATEAAAEEEVVEEEVEETPDPGPQFGEEVQAYLSKYGGDVGRALEAAIHAQAKIGEQGNELGELRRMVQEMYDRPEPRQQASPFVPENVQEAIVDNPSQVAAWAIQNEQTHVFEAAMTEWYEQSPKDAARFERALEREMLKAELQSQITPEIEAVREQQKARSVADAHRTLTAKYQDFQHVLETATADEVAGIDRDLLAATMERNPQTGLEMMYRWVVASRGQQQAAQAVQRTEAVRQEKREAAVVTAEETRVTTEPTVQEKLAELMLAPDAWSIKDSLSS